MWYKSFDGDEYQQHIGSLRNIDLARHALDVLSFSLVNGKPTRIYFPTVIPTFVKEGLQISKDLDKSIYNRELHDTFSTFCPILSCKVATDENG